MSNREPDGDRYAESVPQKAECGNCGNTVSVDDDGYAVCWGTPHNQHSKRTLVRPCGICGDPIRTAEICQDCADESDTDAVTPTWGKHRYD